MAKVVDQIKAGARGGGGANMRGAENVTEGGQIGLNGDQETGGETAAAQSEDDLLEEPGKPFEETLKCLWSVHRRASGSKALTTGTIKDEEAIE